MLDIPQQLYIEQRITNDGKSVLVAYMLWFFFGMFGIHRFYLGKTGTAIAQLVLTLLVITMPISFIWMIVDAFLIPSIVQDDNNQLRLKLIEGMNMQNLAQGHH